MTPAEHAKETTRLKSAVARAKTALAKPMSLSDKIEARRAVNAKEEALRQHKLNFFELTA